MPNRQLFVEVILVAAKMVSNKSAKLLLETALPDRTDASTFQKSVFGDGPEAVN